MQLQTGSYEVQKMNVKNKIIYTFFLFLFLIPFSTAVSRDKVTIYVDSNTWCEDDGVNNYSRFNLNIYPRDDGRDLDIEDRLEYRVENSTGVNNQSLTLRFDITNSTNICGGDELLSFINNVTEVCQTKTEEVVKSNENLKNSKDAVDKELGKCVEEKNSLSSNSSLIADLERQKNECELLYYGNTNTIGCKQELKEKGNNNLIFLGLAFLAGILAKTMYDKRKKIFHPSQTERETPRMSDATTKLESIFKKPKEE